MKGDFSRVSFDPTKHFSGVLMQQGRVTLDADYNEQTAILLHHIRALARDLYGPHGGPCDAGFDIGFDANHRLTISNGNYYVEGMLCECGGTYFDTQPYFRPSGSASSSTHAILPSGTGASISLGIYLDVWENHVTWIEEESIREKALGINGPDTCSRSQLIWQVKSIAATDCASLTGTFAGFQGNAQMSARLKTSADVTDPCAISPDAKYRGTENHLYRVEIHRGNIDDQGKLLLDLQKNPVVPTFKWSRDNGSVVTSWLHQDGNDLIVGSTRGFEGAQWVEITDKWDDLSGSSGMMVKIAAVQNGRLTLAPRLPSDPALPDPATMDKPKIRRWDQPDSDLLSSGAIPIVIDRGVPTLFDLEDGIQVQFVRDSALPPAMDPVQVGFRTGDYWLIPARVATGNIDWPAPNAETVVSLQGNTFASPMGIKHHYAPLAIVSVDPVKSGLNVSDCRHRLMLNPCPNPQPKTVAVVGGKAVGNQVSAPAGAAGVVPAGQAKSGVATSSKAKKIGKKA